MTRLAVISVLFLSLLRAQTQEQNDLNLAIAEAGNSPVDIIHGLEQFLKKYPDTKQRLAIEKQLAKSAIDANDGPRIILYGERVLEAPPGDLQLLDRVTRELVQKKDPDSAAQAIAYVKRYEANIAAMRHEPPVQHLTPGQWSEQLDRAEARAFALHAQAIGNAGNAEEAVKMAQRSWEAFPTSEGAREAGNWLSKLGRDREAIEFYSDAFTLEDPRSTELDRASDRARMGALYTKLNGSEKGLGDLILAAYDRTAALLGERKADLQAKDPNAEAVNIFDFTVPSLDGSPPLPLTSLKGKTIVIDFWATWCVPCRVQHPLIEEVKKRYESAADVRFLAVDSDDDPSLVLPFVKEQGWAGPFYFEAGLERRLVIGSLPTVLVLNPAGQVSSRISGFVPERFEELLVRRIEEARGH